MSNTLEDPELPDHADLQVLGMTCAACVGRVEKALRLVPGVSRASVNLATERASVDFDPGLSSAGQIAEAVKAAGYEAFPAAPGGTAGAAADDPRLVRQQAELAALRHRLIGSVALVVPLHLLGHLHHAAWLPELLRHPGWLLALAAPVQFWGGARFYRLAWHALRRGAADMNTLVALGTSAAFLYSLVATLAPHWIPNPDGSSRPPVYFDTAAIIITLILLGRYLEARAKVRTRDALRRLAELGATSARVERGEEVIEIPIDQVAIGDVFRVRPGEKIATDGLVLEGESRIDESMLTGEPYPVAKRSDSPVFAGTINGSGALRIRATRVGEDTSLAQIIRMVEQAQGSKAPIQRMADAIAGVFVPVVLGIALITLAAWWLWGPGPSFAMLTFISVLIIACPCALGLATPTAIMVGTGRGAEAGILIKSGETLEVLHTIDTVVLDKTGTLTQGRPDLTALEAFGERSILETLRLAASAESESEHPLASALVTIARKNGLDLSPARDFQATTGRGVRATVDNLPIVAGSVTFLRELGLDVTSEFEVRAEALVSTGVTPIAVAVDGIVEGLLGVQDPLREGATEAVRRLRRLGLQVVLLTGDRAGVAQRVATEVGIDRVVAEVLPADKARVIHSLQSEGRKVAMVGDGINDAPALATADVGISMGSGTDVAREASDVTIVRSDPRAIADSFLLGRRTMRTIRENLFWAFIFNVVGIPVAAGVLYPAFGILLQPVFAALAMSFSSVAVLGNSLRLRRFRPIASPARASAIPEPM